MAKKQGITHKHIHRAIKKHAPKSVSKVKRLFYFRYPKLLLLVLAIILAYYLFNQSAIQGLVSGLENFSYLGFFIAGIFFTFGFSAPFSVGFFITLQPSSILLATIIASLGAVAGDMMIFKLIKSSFLKEFNELNHEKIIKTIKKAIENNKNILIRHYLLYIFAGILIATPLPDEIGVSMLAGLTTINPRNLAIIAFVLHAIPIFLILYFSLIL